MSHHLTYLQAVVTGLVQGVTELFPVSSLGHNVLLPALIGGNWASTLNVSAPNSPYLAFVVGLHVATAIAMIAYFWRDWLRIVRGFVSSLRTRSVTTPDERLAWMIILATIPVGIVGVALQKEFIKVFAKPELAAVFLAINGVILLVSERMRRSRAAAGGGLRAAVPAPAGYSQQPQQQQWQGPDPRYGPDENQRYPGDGAQERDGYGRQRYGQPQPGQQQYGQPQPGRQYGQQQFRQPQQGQQYGQQPGQPQYGQDQYGQQYGWDQRGAQPGQGWQPPTGAPPGYDPRDPRFTPGQQPPAGRHGHRGSHAAGHRAADNAAADPAIAADRRLSSMGYKRAVIVGAAQILALMPGISRDGIVTVAGMTRGLTRQDAVRFSFLLSAPVILAAGALKAKDLTGPLSSGIHGPILIGSLISGVCAYLSIRFLTKYFSEDKSLNPFGIYCLIAGIGSLAYLVLK